MSTLTRSLSRGTVGSTGSTVLILVVILVVLGIVMIAVAVWLVRSTRSDPVALGPLEMMGERRWRRRDPDTRIGELGRARPAGAPPPAPVVPFDDAEQVAAEPEPAEPGAGEIGEPGDPVPAPTAHASPPDRQRDREDVEEAH